MSDHAPPPTPTVPGPRLRGVPVTLADGQTYVVPSLNFRQLQDLEPQLKNVLRPAITMEAAERADMLTVFHAALSRNYPELTVEQLGDLVDLEAAGELAFAIAAVNQVREQHGRVVRSP
jgi:hypothetical protein